MADERGQRSLFPDIPARGVAEKPPNIAPDVPPFTTRDFADYTGFSLDKVYELIAEGLLEAEYVMTPGKKRGVYRIHEEDFIACLKRLNWSRLPPARNRQSR